RRFLWLQRSWSFSDSRALLERVPSLTVLHGCSAPRRRLPLRVRKGKPMQLLDLRGLAQRVGAIRGLPRECGGGFGLLHQLAAQPFFPPVGVLERLAAEVAVRGG